MFATSRPGSARGRLVAPLVVYYQVHGAGRPLILLHGGVGASEMFDPVLPVLAENRQVLVAHLQAHGRTADIDRPLSFEFMADDIAALMGHIGISEADFMGYSLGGGVLLQTAIRHPHMVRRLVLISTPVRRHGWYPEVLESMARTGPRTVRAIEKSPLYQLYPDTEWAVLFTKLARLLGQDYDWSDDVAAIKSPPMIVFADADAIQTSHIIEFFGLLGGGERDAGLDGSARPTAQLAVLPGMNHYNILSFPGLAGLVAAFLDATTGENK